jgi:hypothetical protein
MERALAGCRRLFHAPVLRGANKILDEVIHEVGEAE